MNLTDHSLNKGNFFDLGTPHGEEFHSSISCVCMKISPTVCFEVGL